MVTEPASFLRFRRGGVFESPSLFDEIVHMPCLDFFYFSIYNFFIFGTLQITISEVGEELFIVLKDDGNGLPEGI